MADLNPKVIRGLILVIIGWLMLVVATAIPYWWTNKLTKDTGFIVDVGLFKICYYGVCTSIENVLWSNESVRALMTLARACMVISILLIGFSIILCLVYIFILKDRRTLLTATGILNFVASFFTVVAVLVVMVVSILKHPYNSVSIIGYPNASFFLTFFGDFFFFGGGHDIFISRKPGGGVASTPATGFINQTAEVIQLGAPTSGGMVIAQPGVQYPGGMVLGQPGVPTSGGMILGQPGVQYPGGMVLGQPGVPTSGGMVFMQPPAPPG